MGDIQTQQNIALVLQDGGHKARPQLQPTQVVQEIEQETGTDKVKKQVSTEVLGRW